MIDQFFLFATWIYYLKLLSLKDKIVIYHTSYLHIKQDLHYLTSIVAV